MPHTQQHHLQHNTQRISLQELEQLEHLLEKLSVDPRVNCDNTVPNPYQFEIVSAILTIRSKAINKLKEHAIEPLH